MSASFRRNGLAIIAEVHLPANVKGTGTLLLHWGEVALICALLVIGETVVHFRSQILVSWLVSDWALHNSIEAAGAIGGLGLLLGCLLAIWQNKDLFLYSVCEIVFGVFSTFQASLTLFPKLDLASVVAVATTLYIISSGCSHLVEAVRGEIDRVTLAINKGSLQEIWPRATLPEPEA